MRRIHLSPPQTASPFPVASTPPPNRSLQATGPLAALRGATIRYGGTGTRLSLLPPATRTVTSRDSDLPSGLKAVISNVVVSFGETVQLPMLGTISPFSISVSTPSADHASVTDWPEAICTADAARRRWGFHSLLLPCQVAQKASAASNTTTTAAAAIHAPPRPLPFRVSALDLGGGTGSAAATGSAGRTPIVIGAPQYRQNRRWPGRSRRHSGHVVTVPLTRCPRPLYREKGS